MSAQGRLDLGDAPTWTPGTSPPPADGTSAGLRVSRIVLVLGALPGAVHFARYCRRAGGGSVWLVARGLDGSYMPCGGGKGIVWSDLPGAAAWDSAPRMRAAA